MVAIRSPFCRSTPSYCAYLSGEDLSHYSNKIESVGLRKCPYYRYLTKKVMSEWETLRRAWPTTWRKNSWHRYDMKKLRHCRPMYRPLTWSSTQVTGIQRQKLAHVYAAPETSAGWLALETGSCNMGFKYWLFVLRAVLPVVTRVLLCYLVVLVHGQMTIIFIVYVCLSVCLFVCAEFFSAVFDPISIKLGHITHVICLGLVVSPRI